MLDCILSDEERKGLHELQLRAANLKLKKIEGEKEFVEAAGKERSQAECLEIERKRRKIIHELELEGAKINQEFLEKYRQKIVGTPFGHHGDLQISDWCIICKDCVTATCLNCTVCHNCVTFSSL